MAIWWFNKMIVCSTTAFAALFYGVIIVRNHKEKKETGRADDNAAFEIKIANPSSPNTHNGKVFAKNSLSASPNNVPLTSKVGQVVSHLSKQSTSNASVKSRNKKLFSIQLKTEKSCNSIVLNNAIRFFTHDDSNETIMLNNIAFSCESGFGNTQDNLNLIIHIGDSTDLTNNKIQIKIFNKSLKQSMLDVLSISMNHSTNNRSANSIMISQNENQEIGIMISPFNNRHLVNPIITFRGNRSTNTSNNQWTKEIEKNDVTVIINAPV